ncbi:hypothetical protein PTKIN_Ptkin14bG0091500 [Pterospermum kingtungense]
MEVPVSMIIRKKALKPKKKSLKVRAQRIKAEMEKIREDQICIREDQRNIREKFEAINFKCDQLREETERIMKQSACTQIRLSLMFDILKARKLKLIRWLMSLKYFLIPEGVQMEKTDTGTHQRMGLM